MADKIVIIESAFRHGYTQDDIEKAIETNIYEGLLLGEDDIFALVGFDTRGNPMEVFYNLIDDNTIKVFHAIELREKVTAQMYAQRSL